MKIEEAIKQTKPFENEFQKAGVNLMYTHGWYSDQMKRFFKKFNLTPKQYNILRILKGAKQSVSTSFIRERLLDKMSDVSRIVDRMHDKQLLTKTVSKEDKRLVDVQLTDRASDLLNTIKADFEELENVFQNLSCEEARQLNFLLDKLRGN